MGRLSAKIDYEEIRIARILENQAKLASLGLNKTLADLRAVASSAKSVKSHVRKAPKIYYSGMPLRRSSRLTKASTTESPSGHDSLRRSNRLRGIPRDPISLPQGKTDCSVCHSSNGVLCRACLKVRYGEEMDEVRANKNWMCPHCIEEKGINPKWICNSSFCLKKRRMAPTGIAIFRAREMGYKSVAHLIMDELQQTQNRRR
uniref:Zinc-finger domain-containing protein n=1 Tax=Vitis vinifera TaxID=29760 RepID=F6GSP0_VITVI